MSRRVHGLRIGVALGAGAARGWSHIGVLQALDAAGIRADVVCGTSIGSLVGAVYADGRLADLDRWVTDLTWLKVMGFLDVGFGGGLLKGTRLFGHLRENFLDKDIARLPRAYAAVATDLRSGEEVWLREGSVADAVRASIALPGLFEPWQHGGRILVDGGLVNPVPVSLCRALGANFVIAVDLSSQLVGHAMRPLEKERAAAAMPGMLEVVTTSLHIMSARITRSRLAGEPADIVIMPRLGHLGQLDYHRAREAIEEGREATAVLGLQIERLLRA
jgi:NTE family protein